MPTIVSTYEKDAIKINENSIAVTMQFNWINAVGNKVGNKVVLKIIGLTENRQKIMSEIRNKALNG